MWKIAGQKVVAGRSRERHDMAAPGIEEGIASARSTRKARLANAAKPDSISAFRRRFLLDEFAASSLARRPNRCDRPPRPRTAVDQKQTDGADGHIHAE